MRTVSALLVAGSILLAGCSLREVPPTGGVQTFDGVLVEAEPPAPDIDYRYQLILDDPVYDGLQSSGDPVTHSYVVVPAPVLELNLEPFLNTHVRIEGSVEWGYAETRVLHANSIMAIE